jgi:hypothetical protein
VDPGRERHRTRGGAHAGHGAPPVGRIRRGKGRSPTWRRIARPGDRLALKHLERSGRDVLRAPDRPPRARCGTAGSGLVRWRRAFLAAMRDARAGGRTWIVLSHRFERRALLCSVLTTGRPPSSSSGKGTGPERT